MKLEIYFHKQRIQKLEVMLLEDFLLMLRVEDVKLVLVKVR